MSDCQSWLGDARSKRRGPCSRAGLGGGASAIRPASCRTRRTSVSLTPRPSKRASTSRMRRLPQSGCSSRTAVTASCLVRAAWLAGLGGGPLTCGTKASMPPVVYASTHSRIVFGAGPSSSPTRSAGTFCSRTSSTAFSRSASGYAFGPRF